jgi:uncharacterized membrane protein YbhN (UPF0104 family)
VTKRQVLFASAKLAFATAVIWWLFRKVEVARVWTSVSTARPAPVLCGILLTLLTVAIAGWRWQRLLTVFQISVPLRPLIFIAQIGQFFVVFLPGPVGDDLTRMLYISRLAPGRVGEACTTVLLDRCIGLASVLVLAFLCVPSHWSLLSTSRQTYWVALGITTAGAGICLLGIFFFAAGHPTHAWFQKRLGLLPAHSLRDEVARVWGLLCANKKTLAQVIVAALTTQVLLCVVFYLAGVGVGIRVPLAVWLSFVPVVLAANALPITLAGLGVREYLLVLFLGVIAQVDGERALAASFIAFAMILAVCLLGGLLYIFYRPKPRPAAASSSPTALAAEL